MTTSTPTHEKEISSAEMTSTWRSGEPNISFDAISVLMVSEAGLKKARTYQETQYPLASRHMSLRAGYILNHICKLVETGEYDSLISMGSGLSLLTHCVVAELNKRNIKHNLFVFDSDLPYMIADRTQRLKQIPHALPVISNTHFEQAALDIQQTYKDLATRNKTITDIIPATCKKPIFILEGIIYFLTLDCLKWLFNGIKSYDNTAIVFDYIPSDALTRSAFFKTALDYFKANIPENVQSLLNPEDLLTLSAELEIIDDVSLKQAEAKIMLEEKRLLTDENKHIPAHIRVLRKNTH